MTGISITDRLTDPATWDEIVHASDAPLFYRSAALASYQDSPLRTTLDMFFLTVPDSAVLPLFLVPAEDPLGICPTLLPGYQLGGAPLLMSHTWHWYDTHLPARRLDRTLVATVTAAVADLARETRAQAFGLMNIAENSPLHRLLVQLGRRVTPIDARYLLELSRFRTIEDYLASLSPRTRQEMRRHRRRAEQAGYVVTTGPPTAAELAEVADLCRATGAKHGNPGWYDPQTLAGFVCGLASDARIIAIRSPRGMLAASISFVDGRRFHNWAAGTVPLTGLTFSPYQVLLWASIEAALAEGCSVLEGGRRNDAWKERLRLRRQVLVGCLSA